MQDHEIHINKITNAPENTLSKVICTIELVYHILFIYIHMHA